MTNNSASTKNNRRVPALIMGSLVLVVFASTLLFRAAVTGKIDLPAVLGTKNNGVLITPPQPIADLPLQDSNGEPFNYASQEKLWSIIIPAAAHCDDQCEQTLYLTRQIHIALGKDTDRARRYVLTTQLPLDTDFQNLLKQHPNVVVLKTTDADYVNYFGRIKLQPALHHQYLLVDPMGWLMMYYEPRHEFKAVVKDLKFLLSNSSGQQGKN